jgi:acetyl esterase/lipase
MITTTRLATRWMFGVALGIALFSGSRDASAQRGGRAYPPKMEGAEAHVYKTVGDVKLNLYVFKPADWKAGDKRPAVVFFFGGGWANGSPGVFERQCRHFAERGMVAITADYRVKSRHGVTPIECVADAKSAVRWVRAHAAELGVDPTHIAAGGGSAGGHIAACAGVVPGLDEKGEDASVSSKPDALLLFNPAIDSGLLEKRLGERAAEILPARHVKAGDPPTFIAHGKADTTVPYAGVEAFAHIMKKAGNRCDLVGYDGQGHGFFNYRPREDGGGEMYRDTLAKADAFLVSLAYLKPANAK